MFVNLQILIIQRERFNIDVNRLSHAYNTVQVIEMNSAGNRNDKVGGGKEQVVV